MYNIKLMPLSNAAPPAVDTRTRSWPTLFLLGAVALVGCVDQTHITGPVETDVLNESPAIGPASAHAASSHAVVRSVTGTAVRSLPDPDAHGWRTFTIAAVERQDGSVSGQFEMHLRQIPVRVHGRITCIGVQGNAAWLGGVIELIVGSFPVSPGPGPGTPIRIRVVDNGEGAGAPPDLISGLNTMTGQPEGAELSYCEDRPAFPVLLFPVEAGNIRVRG